MPGAFHKRRCRPPRPDSQENRTPAVEVRALVKNYPKVEALKGIDLTVGRGEMFALLGPNGAGKTTLFSILATLRAPTSGTARVLGRDVVTDRDAIRREMGIVFQEPAIEQRLSGRDNLFLMGLLYGHSMSGARKRAAEILAQLGIADSADRLARELSGGQRRKLELARALVTDPRILFLDEATLGLDVDARRMFWGQIRGLADSGRTVFFTTHYMEEAEVADRIALIDSGPHRGARHAVGAQGAGGRRGRDPATDDDARARAWLGEHGFTPEPGGQAITLVHADPAAVLPGPAAQPAGAGAARGGPCAQPRGRVPQADGPRARGRAQAMMRAIFAIVILDLKRFWLDRARLIAGLIQPLLYLFVLGAGIGASVKMGGGDYRRFIFPGTMGLSLLFSATFAAITIVFDRQIGFFKAVLVAPVPRSAIALGKIIAGALQSLAQGLILLPFAPLAGASLNLAPDPSSWWAPWRSPRSPSRRSASASPAASTRPRCSRS